MQPIVRQEEQDGRSVAWRADEVGKKTGAITVVGKVRPFLQGSPGSHF